MKTCRTCGEEKSVDNFRLHKNFKDGRGIHCKECVNLARNEKENPDWHERLLLRKAGKKECPQCGEIKQFSEFPTAPDRMNGVGGWCKSCKAKDSKRLYWDDPEKSRKDARKRSAEWKERNPHYSKKYYSENRERYMEYGKWYRSTEVGKRSHLLSEHRRRKNADTLVNDLTSSDIDFLLELQDNICVMCGGEFTNENKYTLDHILPLSKGGGLTLENIQLLHHSCNSSKGTKTIRYRKLIKSCLDGR